MLGRVAWMVVFGIYGALPVAPAGQPRPGWETFNLWAGVAGALLMLGLTGAYLYQRRQTGWLGRAGVLLAWAGALAIGAGRLVRINELVLAGCW